MAGTNSRLETKWEKIARTFSRNHNVNVRLTGAACAADLKTGTVFIPANADDYKDGDAQVLEGMLDHEWKHIEVEQAARKAGIPTPLQRMNGLDKNERMWFNVFEDYRIEAELSRDYVGCGQNVEAMNDRLHELNRNRSINEIDYMKAVGLTVLGRLAGTDVDWLPKEAVELADELEPIWRNVETMETFDDAVALAKEIVEYLGKRAEPEEPDEANADGEGQAAGGDGDEGDEEREQDQDDGEDTGGGAGDDESDDEGDDAGEDGDGGEDQGDGGESDAGENNDSSGNNPAADGDGEDTGGEEDAGGDNGDDDSDEDGDGNGEGEPGSTGGDPDHVREFAKKALENNQTEDMKADIKENLNQIAEQNAKENKRHIPHPETVKRDRVINGNQAHASDFNTLKKEVNKQISALKAKLVSVLKTRTLKGAILDRESGHIDGAALYRLKQRDRNVFMEPGKVIELDTAVSMIIDMSGSMNQGGARLTRGPKGKRVVGGGSRIQMAVKSAIALAETMEQLGVPVEISGFYNDVKSYSLYTAWREDGGVYTRHVPYTRTIFKAFTERWKSVKTRLNSEVSGKGVNCDCEAVLWAAKRLAVRNERRKILIVLSDGQPNLDSGHDINTIIERDLKIQVGRIEQAGINVMGLGIKSDAVKSYYPNNAVINNLDDLPKAVFNALKRFMV